MSPSHPRIGVLSLQGAFAEHETALRALGAEAVEVRVKRDLDGLEGMVLPGGESTVMGRLLREEGLMDPVRELCLRVPVLATCAGMILLAARLPGHEDQPRLGIVDMAVLRNAFGRQKESFVTDLEVEGFGECGPCRAVFIRAPLVTETGGNVRVLARVDGRAVAVREKRVLALSFHPELGTDTRFHAWLVREALAARADMSPPPAGE